MIRLLDPHSSEDIELFRAVLTEIAAKDHPVYYQEGLQLSFDNYVKLFSTIETDPAKQMYVSVEIQEQKIVRMIITCSMNKLWTNMKGMVHYFALLLWYTAPGHTKTNFLDNAAGYLAFDKFIQQQMYTYVAVMKGPKLSKSLVHYTNKMFKGAQRINVYIDKYIDTQEKLDHLREFHPGFNSLLPKFFKNPMIMYTGIIKPEFRNYDIVQKP